MGSFSTLTVSLLLFLVFQLPGQAQANPVYNGVSNADLMDLKNLLDHLEEKMPLEEEVMPQVPREQNDEAGAVLSVLPEAPSWTGEANPVPRDGGALGRGPWDSPDRSALLKGKLRALLTAPRSLRRSSCFGGRIDRIGTQSGLGCNSFRVRDGDGNGGGGEEVVVSLRFKSCQRLQLEYAPGRKGAARRRFLLGSWPQPGMCPLSLRTALSVHLPPGQRKCFERIPASSTGKSRCSQAKPSLLC
ncbi:Natriuretic peptide A [Fukomys damarensis]|uniref:Natriuretic peptides A n=1 Tax=Fukomys damarensis TaxID=885580 RepID=A0A091DMA4_FUKDA|nr:Natriuretic peptide A [Fukomys damarensis]